MFVGVFTRVFVDLCGYVCECSPIARRCGDKCSYDCTSCVRGCVCERVRGQMYVCVCACWPIARRCGVEYSHIDA